MTGMQARLNQYRELPSSAAGTTTPMLMEQHITILRECARELRQAIGMELPPRG